MTTDYDVLIAGAGPTGLTLACDLRRRGIAVRIIDAAAQPFVGSRGKGLQPRTLEVFDDLGILDAITAAGIEYPRLRLHWRRFTIGHWRMQEHREPSPDVPYPNPWLVPQWRTEGILRARLAELGGGVEFGTQLGGFVQDDGGVTATLRTAEGETPCRARFLVGADGGHSFVRKALAIGFAGETHEGERMVVGDVRVDGLARDKWHIWPRAKGGIIALCPLPSSDLFQLTVQLPRDSTPPELTDSVISEYVARATGDAKIRLRDSTWLSLYRPNVRLAQRFRVGRVFLAGDAAHVHPPTGGQGLNTGVQDAYNLGWKLAHVLRGAPATLLDTYEEERLPIAASVLGIATELYKKATSRKFGAHKRGPATQQLGLNYRGRTLARTAGHAPSALQPGDRAPDAPVNTQKGAPRLFDLFRGPHFTLLAFGSGLAELCALTEAEWSGVVRAFQVDGEARQIYGVATGRSWSPSGGTSGNELVLVRPDGYLAWRGTSPSALNRLAEILHRRVAPPSIRVYALRVGKLRSMCRS